MSSGPVLKGELPVAGAAPRVVLRSQPAASVAAPAPAGMWITELDLAALKRQWVQQAREEGCEEGRREAQAQAQTQAAAEAKARLERELNERDEKNARSQAEKWRGLATALADQMQSLRAQLLNEVSEWTFIAAARLLGQRTREDVVHAVRHVLADAQLEGAVTLLVNEQDLAIIEAARAADANGWPAELAFAASDRLPLGGCLLQSPAQTLDARLEVQLALLREALDVARREQLSEA